MADNKTIKQKLADIQQAIRVPKDLDNDFAGFKYRSAESILEKLKPLLKEENATVILFDELEEKAGQVYVKGTAQFIDLVANEVIEVAAFAREEKTRPKMSEGQLTGAASSYARKYALNGLLLLDDTKDPDSQDNTKNEKKSAPAQDKKLLGKATDKQRETITKELNKIGISAEESSGYLIEQFGVEVPLTKEGASFVISELFERNKGASGEV